MMNMYVIKVSFKDKTGYLLGYTKTIIEADNQEDAIEVAKMIFPNGSDFDWIME